MRAGHGRGYYGEGQLEQRASRGRNWFTIVAVLGVGATVVWLLWPRRAASDFGYGSTDPVSWTPPAPITATVTTDVSPPTSATGAFLKQVEDDARSRGFLEVKDYEDSVVASAKQLQAAGATVMLAPHLQHLVPQLGSGS